MSIILFVFAVFLFSCEAPKFKRLTASSDGTIFDNYMAKQSTLPVKGLFVLFVMFSHFRGYVTLNDSSILDASFNTIVGLMGQLMVVMFLFYSGYGIYEQYKKRGNEYLTKFFLNRFIPTWGRFVVCILIYLIYAWIDGASYTTYEIAFAFTGWTSIGNSNWYMFIIFAEYALLILCGYLVRGDRKLLIYTLFTLILQCVLMLVKESYWWNTMICLPAGMWYSKYKVTIDTKIQNGKWNWLLTLLGCGLAFVITYLGSHLCSYIYPVCAILFALCVVIVTMKLQLRSKLFVFLGEHVFSIYILQREVFHIVCGLITKPIYAFCVSFVCVATISYAFDYLSTKIESRIFKKRS